MMLSDMTPQEVVELCAAQFLTRARLLPDQAENTGRS
jgi:hypothetical protein